MSIIQWPVSNGKKILAEKTIKDKRDINSNFAAYFDLNLGILAVAQKITNFHFSDIGGCQEAKEELKEIVSFFRDPQFFQQSGAKMPKGVLLVGPHGNGKTLLGKALAGECQLPFLFRSGSEFEEMLVGLGARRMRELFAEARSYPRGCIIFIDEIDSIGRRRNTPNSNDLTLNQLLNELDGFRPREKIFILAATNFPQILDAALLRPGRFDRQIYVPLPNLQARREIIKLAAPKATLLCLRYGQKKISQELIFEAHDRVLMGPSSTSHTIHPNKKKIIAFHEAGHAIVGLSLPETSQGDDNLISKNQILAQIAGFLGGRAAEELIFGLEHITVGAHSDFKKASQLVSEFIFHHGMSSLGIVPPSEFFY
ncbi:21693_t:CDS:2 [Gigaspora margarita]|uniref:21693_t:CDS:1 n=1 Tax=Gigaspora margarita TaxID=4874 RepID=A0ABM8VV97_GIGMA|nr:21693_t:CDS:2 [Gigaspora margarita]